MKKENLRKLLEKIEELNQKLAESENNLQYITRLKALRSAYQKFDKVYHSDTDYVKEYGAEYLQLFYSGAGWSPYDRVLNSILDYEYGNKPF